MKILLLQDVRGVGKRGEIKNVADGYAQNAILPKKLGVIATADVLKRYEAEQKQRKDEEELQSKLAQQTFADLSEKTIVIKANASDKGHLFASMHAEEIIKALKDQEGVTLNPSWIELKHPIKETGIHKLKLHAHGVNGVLTVEVK